MFALSQWSATQPTVSQGVPVMKSTSGPTFLLLNPRLEACPIGPNHLRSLQMRIDRKPTLLLNPQATQLPKGEKEGREKNPHLPLKKKNTNSSCFKTQQACFSFIYFYINTLKDKDLSHFKSCQFALVPCSSSV